MRKLFVFSMLSLIICSCSSDSDVVKSSGDAQVEQTVNFSFVPYSMTATRGVTSISDAASRLSLWIIQGTDTTTYYQMNTDTDYGSLSMVLNKTKEYRILAIAHNCNGLATISNGVISFPENKVTQSFYYNKVFKPDTIQNLSCVMNRMVAQFKMETTDAFPKNAQKMRFTTYQTGTTFNVNDSTSGNKIDKVTLYNPVQVREADNTAIFSVTLLSDKLGETGYFTIRAESMDKDDNLIEEKLFENVPIKVGYVTLYRGTFFTSESIGAGFSVEDWNNFGVTNF